ncbi:MAG: multifunctional CCA tRNA nucleotidyl transferase/2'3'-cyclic phosphodiesterase/2'nucleotidase/phosphatase [Limnobacter sp.]|nr:multifunctional CCA tRNA nucleotidyl transferase/2'3'-cyclic phosphodiesterase/2'nucleotidase/phosphatase [Limnobacter sp.]
MQVYCVGGAVRDELLGLPVRDRDWVVVGATPAMLEARGFRPVGRDFPVFLHPQTQEEYALARTERKSGNGYRGFVTDFSPDVTLEDDLRRRDLTINAIARSADGTLVDPWNGRRDLEQRVLRHVSPAFVEDPVRILRVARFAARFADFTIADETMSLMRTMVERGEVDHLVPERVWQEIARGLMEAQPSRMLEVLRECGALARIVAELDAAWTDETASMLDAAAARDLPLAVRFAVLVHAVPAERIDALAASLRAPTDCRDVARLLARELPTLRDSAHLDADALASLVERLDGPRRPQRMEQVLAAAGIVDERAALDRVRQAATAIGSIDAGAIARAGPATGIRERLHAARVEAVREALLRTAGPGPSPAATAGSSKSAG